MSEQLLNKSDVPTLTSDSEADRENVSKMRRYEIENNPDMTSKDITDWVVRLYGATRREGLTPQDAAEFMFDTDPHSEVASRKQSLQQELDTRSSEIANQREEKNIAIERARKVVEMGGYAEKLKDPEEYLYHGSRAEPESVIEKGLMGNLRQDPDATRSIDLWNGTDQMHENPSSEVFYGYLSGDMDMYRVKKTDLNSLGFDLVPYPEGNPATHAIRKNPIVPTEMLEKLDRKLKLWVPVADKTSKPVNSV